MKAPVHPDQTRRLAALSAYRILDTAPEAAFDDLARLVAAICEVPVALISLVEEDRQWFKARHGLDASETPIGQSICAHAILGEDILEIEDTLADPRSADNPLCAAANGYRFYAGAPLRTPEGLPLGSLCVLDHRPRRLTALQRQTLRVLADQVMAQLRLRLALSTAETFRREADHRVRNSLQSLAALTRFETRRVESPEARAALESITHRIGAVAKVHDQLYRLTPGEAVRLDAFLSAMADQLAATAPAGVAVTGRADSIAIASSDAIMLGTLFNEIVANACKHAFPDGRPGRIAYAATRLPDGRIRFTCEDDGIGLAGAGDRGEGLGTALTQAIALELDGTLDAEPLEPGLRIRMEFTPKPLLETQPLPGM